MSTAPQIAQLRARAQHLRNVSNMLACSPALTVYRSAGPDTWVGPTAQRCFDALVGVSRQLDTHRQSMCETARNFDRRADELERHPPIVATVS